MSERMAIVLYENKNGKKGTDETESLLGLERNIYICILLEIIIFNFAVTSIVLDYFSLFALFSENNLRNIYRNMSCLFFIYR